MLRKVFKTGNSFVISLPKEALDLLGITEGSRVFVNIDRDRRQIVISPVVEQLAGAGIGDEYTGHVAEFIDQYRTALEALSNL